MALNLSEESLQVYFNANTAVSIALFMVMVLPSLLLCLLCELALLFATEINKKIRVLLINIFSAEVCNWFSYSVFYLGWPARFIYDDGVLCKVYISSLRVVTVQKFTAGAMYAINIYLFIKHGDSKLRWYTIIPFIVLSWLLTIVTVGVIPYLDNFGAVNSDGFCRSDSMSVSYQVLISISIILAFIFLIIQLIFSIFVVVHVKRNALKGNTYVKRAVAILLGFVAVYSVLSFINGILPVVNPVILNEVVPPDDMITKIVVNYLLRIFYNIPSIALPIFTIVLLKPIRAAIKNLCTKVYPCVRRPTQSNPETSTSVHSVVVLVTNEIS